MEYYVYVLKSGIDDRLYKGQTTNLERRIKEHNSGKTSSSKAYRPWKLVYFETFGSREDALKREKYFKSGIGREFLLKKIRPRGAIE